MSTTPTKHNTNALLVGTGEFRFCPGASSAADARLKGFRDFGNIVAFVPETENTIEEHEGSYRGRKIVDRKFAVKSKLDYLLTQDEFKAENLKLLFMADDAAANFTQSAQTFGAADSLAFTVGQPSADSRWYDIYVSGAPVNNLTALRVSDEAAVAVTADDTTDKITENAHGRSDGDTVIFGGTAAPAGLTAGTIYYIRDSTANDYKIAATSGGTAIDLTSTGTAVTVRNVLVLDTDYEEDLTLGCIRFLTAQSATVYPIVSAPAIADSGDAGFMYGVTPLQTPILEGYGRLIIYDQDADNQVVVDHRDFKCQVSADKANTIDGKKPGDFTVRVSVNGEYPGTMYCREGEPS